MTNVTKAEAAREVLARREARNSLIGFTRYIKYGVKDPEYRPAAHHMLLASALEAVERGEITRLIVNMPPRHGKSTLISQHFPPWYLGRHPNHEIILASYAREIGTSWGRDARDIIASQKCRYVFPHLELSPDSQAKNLWHTTAGGQYLAAGIGSGATGRGAHVLLIDDPVKDLAEAASETVRKTVWDWFCNVAYTRLAPGGRIVLVMTRWAEQDLAGTLIEREASIGERWEKIILPAINERGEALWPEQFPLAHLHKIKSLNEYTWDALFMQRPRPPGGSFFTQNALLVVDPTWEAPADQVDAEPRLIPVDTPKRIDTVFAIVDTAVKTGQEHSGLGCIFFGYCSTGIAPPLTILDYDYTQIEGQFLENWLPGVIRRLDALSDECEALRGSSGVHIEDKASGMVLIQKGKSAGWPVHAIKGKLTTLGKTERAISVSDFVFRGDVKFTWHAFTKTVSYLGSVKNHLLSQLLNFRASGDALGQQDLLDCFSYGVGLALQRHAGELLDEDE